MQFKLSYIKLSKNAKSYLLVFKIFVTFGLVSGTQTSASVWEIFKKRNCHFKPVLTD